MQAALGGMHLDAVLGIALLGYLIVEKIFELRARRVAVKVAAQVVKVFPHRHATSYFVRYRWQDEDRSAELRGPPLRRIAEPGDTLEILIDPASAADVTIPDAVHDAPGATVGGGTCTLASAPRVSWLEVVWAIAAIVLIVRSFA